MAGFNYGYERNKMEREFAQIAAVCRAEGIQENTIEIIHRILLDEVNNDRRYYAHTQSYDGLQFPDGETAEEGQSPLLKNHLERLSVVQAEIWTWSYFSWVEDIDTPEIAVWIKSLDESDIMLLTLLIVDNLKQAEAAKVLGKHESAISRKLKQLRESLAKILPEWLKREYRI